MFKALGVALAIYVCYAAINGSVFAKSGARGTEVLREETPGYFGAVIVVYAGLSLALVFVF